MAIKWIGKIVYKQRPEGDNFIRLYYYNIK